MQSSRSPRLIESVWRLLAEDGIIVTSDSFKVVKIWDLATDRSWFSGQLVMRNTVFGMWATTNSLDVILDLSISGNGSKISELGSELIKTWSMQTGENTGHVELQGIGMQGGASCAWI